jgi:zinc/manganese transport system ATP-binding protein
MLYCNHDRPFVADLQRNLSTASGGGRPGHGLDHRDLGAMISLETIELRHGARVVFSGLSDTIEPGQLTALVGPNGSGKTTLLRAIAGLHPVSAGQINRNGLQSADIALLPQGSHLDRSFPITCQDVVALASARLGPFRAVGPHRRAATKTALARVDLADMASRPIQALSAGQFQRVLFARTIVQDARLILLDEPFNAVDTVTTRLLLSVIADWHTQGRTVIAVLHDMDLVRRFFSKTLTLPGQSTPGQAASGQSAPGQSPPGQPAHFDLLPDPGRQAA